MSKNQQKLRYWIVLGVNGDNVIYFNSFGAEHIKKDHDIIFNFCNQILKRLGLKKYMAQSIINKYRKIKKA